MVKEKIVKATHGSKETPLIIGNTKIDCYVLEDGRRVLSGNGMTVSLGMTVGSSQKPANFIKRSWLNPYISGDLAHAINNPVKFKIKNGGTALGFEAMLLPKLCEAILRARRDGKLDKKQEYLAIHAEILQGAFATVGIIALIDEATGYQHDREQYELHKILEKYISKELLPWQKRFPDSFYQELFRLNGWDYTVNGIQKRPSVIGKWTNKLVYEQLPDGVLKELQENVPKSQTGNKTARFHQLLTLDIGNPHLTAQINQVLTLFRLSDSMKHMWEQFAKLKARQSGQLEMPFEFNEKGHTIAPIEIDTLSDFNKNIKTALNYNQN
jgi:hypothetical protein